jgi:outer membrane scaffolding protein for murein synthesis (MipA/OmpV family)
MTDLPLVVEVGPVLKYNFVDTASEQVQLRLPLRYGTGLHEHGLQGVGWISDPGLWVSGAVPFLKKGWDWGASVNVDLQNRSYNQFYYGVGASNVTAQRSLYDARGGYSGSYVRVGLVRHIQEFIISGFVGVSDLAGASFEGSPLVERTTNYYAGVAFIWVFRKSSEPSKIHGYEDMR